jgi:hypothetical protein
LAQFLLNETYRQINPCRVSDQVVVCCNFAKNCLAKRSLKREEKLRVKISYILIKAQRLASRFYPRYAYPTLAKLFQQKSKSWCWRTKICGFSKFKITPGGVVTLSQM